MSLLNLLKKNKDARKVFGAGELKIIEKQLLGVNLTQSEKNRLSRDIRKKFEFISKVSGFEDDFKLKKGAEIKDMIKEAKAVILSDALNRKIKKITIYGSAAENKLTLNSDIDIAVELNKTNLKEATIFRKRILGKVNRKIDIQVSNTLSKDMQNEINTKGKILYEQKSA
jgi:predicted nucleotidyltransferase